MDGWSFTTASTSWRNRARQRTSYATPPECWSVAGASTVDSLSFAGTGTDAELPQERIGTVANVVFPTAHRPARRSRLARSIRRLLRDGRQSDRGGASRCAGISAARSTRRPVTCRGLASNQRRVADRRSSGDSDGGQRRIIANMTHLAANAARIVGGHEEKAAGSKGGRRWGPKEVDTLIAADGCWHNPRPKGA